MTEAAIWYASDSNSVTVDPVTFLNAAGTATDPGTVNCVVTDPAGNATTYNYNGLSPFNTITRTGTGKYALSLPGLTTAGLWLFVWIGTGSGVSQVTPGTFRVQALSDTGTGVQYWYAGPAELKSRLGIDDDTDDYEIGLALSAATDAVTTYCGQHFYQLTEARTFRPEDFWCLHIDPLVTVSSVALDFDGDGVYEKTWIENQDYQLSRYPARYNANDTGVPRPRNFLRALSEPLPVALAFTPLNRVKVSATWGWASVPPKVTHATLVLATDYFKSKDSPFGVAGSDDFGVIRVRQNPMVASLLNSYRDVSKTTGV